MSEVVHRGSVVTNTARAEAFSDGVIAIVITLLALELHPPQVEHGGLLRGLLAQWPTYAAYTSSYLFIAIVWLNHRAAFMRIRVMDRGLHWANLAILFTTALVPFSTSVLTEAFEANDLADERTAAALYALVGVVGNTTWLWFFHYLSAHPELLEEEAHQQFFAGERGRAILGIVLYVLTVALSYVLHPLLPLATFVGLAVYYALTSDGPFQKPALRRRGT